jgi:NAD+ kinase
VACYKGRMKLKLQCCAVSGSFADPRVAESAQLLIASLKRRQIAVCAAREEMPAALAPGIRLLPRAELARNAQLMVAIGGDGTLLQAARLAASDDMPVLGINRGRLGFLTDVLPQDIEAAIAAVLGGACSEERRALLAARLAHPDGSFQEQLALNDVVLLRRETGRMLDFETRVGQSFVNSHSGDGFVVATATGSTAYALSCGGPIVDPALNVLVMAPICPHTMSDRPIIVSGDSHIEIRLREQEGQSRADVTCDGMPLAGMALGDRLQIRASGRAVRLLHPPGYDYFRALRSKLHWGRGDESTER